MQYIDFFSHFLNIFTKNLDCGYTLRAGTRYVTSAHSLCFGTKIRNDSITLHTPVSPYKVGYKVVYISRTYFPDVLVVIISILPNVFRRLSSTIASIAILGILFDGGDGRINLATEFNTVVVSHSRELDACRYK